jgi:hypothetical protein
MSHGKARKCLTPMATGILGTETVRMTSACQSGNEPRP